MIFTTKDFESLFQLSLAWHLKSSTLLERLVFNTKFRHVRFCDSEYQQMRFLPIRTSDWKVLRYLLNNCALERNSSEAEFADVLPVIRTKVLLPPNLVFDMSANFPDALSNFPPDSTNYSSKCWRYSVVDLLNHHQFLTVLNCCFRQKIQNFEVPRQDCFQKCCASVEGKALFWLQVQQVLVQISLLEYK